MKRRVSFLLFCCVMNKTTFRYPAEGANVVYDLAGMSCGDTRNITKSQEENLKQKKNLYHQHVLPRNLRVTFVTFILNLFQNLLQSPVNLYLTIALKLNCSKALYNSLNKDAINLFTDTETMQIIQLIINTSQVFSAQTKPLIPDITIDFISTLTNKGFQIKLPFYCTVCSETA